ncbi:MAG: hypothetical protein AVDCRST_MAG30-2035 [uncultured Solirubrobacteraceae bacterium]|uniref:Uncharacterized protein n=1 Tax=uncultured Solirubrobacteraceae bacterium TaxID=1162706 RepID=A0A6J4SR82_9ACTN|nr:MAG: hypothetical protein AVDCRST_MAG30-2035 [uncultured Solirubrobacteraceae bacterium]
MALVGVVGRLRAARVARGVRLVARLRARGEAGVVADVGVRDAVVAVDGLLELGVERVGVGLGGALDQLAVVADGDPAVGDVGLVERDHHPPAAGADRHEGGLVVAGDEEDLLHRSDLLLGDVEQRLAPQLGHLVLVEHGRPPGKFARSVRSGSAYRPASARKPWAADRARERRGMPSDGSLTVAPCHCASSSRRTRSA